MIFGNSSLVPQWIPSLLDMALRVCLALICCLTSVLLAPHSEADRKRNLNELLVEDERARLSKHSFTNVAVDPYGGVLADGADVAYAIESLYPDAAPQELPALIVDYANMIRNDIVLLDNSVQTRTRKRGNIKVKKHQDPKNSSPCSCIENSRTRDLGPLAFPRYLNYKVCSERCSATQLCTENLYNVTVFRRKTPKYFESDGLELPKELNKWVAKNELVTVGCTCTQGYVDSNNLNRN